MTFAEACKELGYAKTPDIGPFTQELVVKMVQRITAEGKELTAQQKNLIRAQIEMMG